MSRALARCLFICLLVLTFALQQTGMSRAEGDCCEDEDASAELASHEGADVCSESAEPEGCAPACVDCLGCAGPARILLSAAMLLEVPDSIATTMERRTPGVAIGRDTSLRLERPPRA